MRSPAALAESEIPPYFSIITDYARFVLTLLLKRQAPAGRYQARNPAMIREESTISANELCSGKWEVCCVEFNVDIAVETLQTESGNVELWIAVQGVVPWVQTASPNYH